MGCVSHRETTNDSAMASAPDRYQSLTIFGFSLFMNALMLVVGFATVRTPTVFPWTMIGAPTYRTVEVESAGFLRVVLAPYSPFRVRDTSRHFEKSAPIFSLPKESKTTFPEVSVI